MLIRCAPEALLVGPEPAEERSVLGAWSRVLVALGLRVGIPRPAIVPAGLPAPAEARKGHELASTQGSSFGHGTSRPQGAGYLGGGGPPGYSALVSAGVVGTARTGLQAQAHSRGHSRMGT